MTKVKPKKGHPWKVWNPHSFKHDGAVYIGGQRRKYKPKEVNGGKVSFRLDRQS